VSRHPSKCANKSKVIRDLLGIGRMEVELSRREVLAHHALAWLVEVSGSLTASCSSCRREPGR